jgi:IS5 family transposase
MRPGQRRALAPRREVDRLLDKVDQLKASMRAEVEHPFRVVKQQFGYAKVRYRDLAKNTARLSACAAARSSACRSAPAMRNEKTTWTMVRGWVVTACIVERS